MEVRQQHGLPWRAPQAVVSQMNALADFGQAPRRIARMSRLGQLAPIGMRRRQPGAPGDQR